MYHFWYDHELPFSRITVILDVSRNPPKSKRQLDKLLEQLNESTRLGVASREPTTVIRHDILTAYAHPNNIRTETLYGLERRFRIYHQGLFFTWEYYIFLYVDTDGEIYIGKKKK